MLPYIPPELIDQIIDHLHNDPKSLNACALVARGRLPSARYHRFQSAKKIDSLHQSSQIAPGPLPYYQEATICDNSGCAPISTLEAAANACLTLPNLERIKFNNRTYASTPMVVTILSPTANMITTLDLSGTLFASSNDFWPLICSFPNLSVVQVCGVTFGSTGGTTFFPVNTYEPPLRPSAFPLHEGVSLLSTSSTLLSPSASSKISKFSPSTPTELRWFPLRSQFMKPSNSCDLVPFQFIAQTTKVGLTFRPIIYLDRRPPF